MIKHIPVAPGLELSFSVTDDDRPMCDLWLNVTAGPSQGSLCLNHLGSPICRQAFMKWAENFIKDEQAKGASQSDNHID